MSGVQADQPHSHNAEGQAILNENKYAEPVKAAQGDEIDEFDFESADNNVDYEVFETEDDEDEYISPKKSAANLGKNVHVKFQICTS